MLGAAGDYPDSLKCATAMGRVDSSVECGAPFVRIAPFVCGFGVWLRGVFVDAEGAAHIAESSGAKAIGHDSEAADTLEAVGKGMEQEAPNELVPDERRGSVVRLALSRLFRLPGADGNLLTVNGKDAPVADYDSMRREQCRR